MKFETYQVELHCFLEYVGAIFTCKYYIQGGGLLEGIAYQEVGAKSNGGKNIQ